MPGPSPEPYLSIVVPVRNGEDVIGGCIESLLAQRTEIPHEVIVVDNCSTDATAAAVRRYPVKLVSEPAPGVSNARNRGISESAGEVVAFLDGDCTVAPGWLDAIAAPFADPEVGCVAGELAHTDGETLTERQSIRKLGDWQRFAISADPPYAVTANAAYHRSALERIGGFDPALTRAQDVELGIRFHHESGMRMEFAPGAVAHHRHHATQLGYFRQQLGWAYGAGLVAAKREVLHGEASPRPKARYIALNLQGLALVGLARLRGRARPEWLHDAWFDLLQQIGWYIGANVGIRRGARIYRGRARASRSRRPGA